MTAALAYLCIGEALLAFALFGDGEELSRRRREVLIEQGWPRVVAKIVLFWPVAIVFIIVELSKE